MNARCVVCGERCATKRSRKYCSTHYWQRRRLLERPTWELERVIEESELTKKLIAIILDEQCTEGDVADLQR